MRKPAFCITQKPVVHISLNFVVTAHLIRAFVVNTEEVHLYIKHFGCCKKTLELYMGFTQQPTLFWVLFM